MFGLFLQACINIWISLTGKRVAIADYPFLDGPMAEGNVVGEDFYAEYAKKKGLEITRSRDLGLVDDFSLLLDPKNPLTKKLNPLVAEFYEHTGRYKLDVWSQWFSFMRPFARILIQSVSSRMNQLNIPLDSLETSHGMGSDIIRLTSKDGQQKLTCWLRKTLKSNQVVYAGFYSDIYIEELGQHFVRVVFPLPKGNVTVVLSAELDEDGSMKLVSHGKKIGEPGYYRLRKSKDGFVKVKFLPLKEIIHVFEDKEGVMRTDHVFYFWGIKLLHLHYKISEARRSPLN